MPRRFKIIYRLDGCEGEHKLPARSKYNAKQQFYILFPRAEIVRVEEVDE